MSTTVKLNSGYEMPLLGLGTWMSKPGEVGKAIEFALRQGYRLIDCAHSYSNQKEIGTTLEDIFASGVVKREEVFITSKVWNTCHYYDAAIKNIDEILSDLCVSYVDLMLIHWPMGYQAGPELFPVDANGKRIFSDADYLETWKALEAKVKEGKIRSIGLSNFNTQQIERVIQNCEIKPCSLQVELHPYFQRKELVNFCKAHSISVTGYCPLGNPSMPFHKEGDPNVLHDPVVTAIANKYGKTNAQVALRGLIQIGVAVIPKSVNESRIKQNSEIWDFSLTADELKQFEGLDQNRRFLCIKAREGDHPFFPY